MHVRDVAWLMLWGLFFGCRAEAPSAPPVERSNLVQPKSPSRSYGRKIVLPRGPTPALTRAIDDAREHLRSMTGVSFEARDGVADEGVILRRASDADAPRDAVERLRNQGPEAYVLRSESGSRLWLVANDDAGLIYGLYGYLHRLGCRWFLPADVWTHMPSRTDVALDVDVLVKPQLKMRGFAGTGGFGPRTPRDATGALAERWASWKLRNGFGGEFALAGHTGEAFNTKHRKLFEKHPEYLAWVDGKRSAWSPIVKLDVSNPEVARLYIEDRLAELRRVVEKSPNSPSAFAVSVEPADGGGHCECSRCLAIGNGSVSDRVFHFANQVAKAIRSEFPDRYVSLYAYDDHAEVPTIPLEPNVYVSVAPDAFQRAGLTPSELLAAWQRKVKRMSVYTYWAIPDWNGDLPSFDFLRTPAESLETWKRYGVEGAQLETSYAAGAVGLGLYVLGRLTWDPIATAPAVLSEFYGTAFGAAAPAMRRMLERWRSGFMLSQHELALSFRDVQEAQKLAATQPAPLARIRALEGYVEYLRRWYDYSRPPATGPAHLEAARELLRWSWRIYDSAMVSTFRIHQLVTLRRERGTGLREAFDENDAQAAFWRETVAPTHGDLDALVARGVATYQPVQYRSRKFSEELVAVVPFGEASPKAPKSHRLRLAGDIHATVAVAPTAKTWSVRVRALANKRATSVTLRLARENGAVWFSQEVAPDGEWHALSIPLDTPRRYLLEVAAAKTVVDIELGNDVRYALRPTFASPDVSTPYYFFVPSGTRAVVIYAPGAQPVTMVDASGTQRAYTGDDLITVPVPAGTDGAVWSMRGYKSWTPFRLLNVPGSVAAAPGVLLRPTDS